mmetsp:Transcript_5237/g.16813  ORF Transcript_5237/g.16813 Transcript_5237/m.16813 type:complete len:250 (+) Transcript_5237:621-1370(+)
MPTCTTFARSSWTRRSPVASPRCSGAALGRPRAPTRQPARRPRSTFATCCWPRKSSRSTLPSPARATRPSRKACARSSKQEPLVSSSTRTGAPRRRPSTRRSLWPRRWTCRSRSTPTRSTSLPVAKTRSRPSRGGRSTLTTVREPVGATRLTSSEFAASKTCSPPRPTPPGRSPSTQSMSTLTCSWYAITFTKTTRRTLRLPSPASVQRQLQRRTSCTTWAPSASSRPTRKPWGALVKSSRARGKRHTR